MHRSLAWLASIAICLSTLPMSAVAQSSGDTDTAQKTETETPQGGGSGSWRRYAAWGGLGLGGALVISGFAVDAATGGRVKRLGKAIEGGNLQKVRRVEEQARKARTTAILLYGFGGAFAVAGGTLYVLELTAGNSNSASDRAVELRVGPRRIGISLDW